ncbi:FAD binding domain-containing protein [Saccharomonospora sp. NPDC006951]
MRFLRPGTMAEACALKAEYPDALVIAGGTDVMVGVNFGRTDPLVMLDLTGIGELAQWRSSGEDIHIGAGLTYSRIVAELGDALPALASASRTVGSVQIRNRATLAGNLGTASPAGDALPPLLAADAAVELVSAGGARTVPATEFCVAPGRSVLQRDELIAGVRIARRRGPQHFAKVGPRNAMVIAVASIATTMDPANRTVAVGCGAVAPTPVRARAAEEFAAAALDWNGEAVLPKGTAAEFGALVADACSPIDDVRAGARYRRRAIEVLAGRALRRMWDEHLRRVE